MDSWLLAHETWFRLSAFAGVLGLMLGWETLGSWRRYPLRWDRRLSNLGLAAVSALLLRFAMPVLATGVAIQAADSGWGLFNLVAVPMWLAVVASFLVLDLAIWAQHVVFHKVGWLWRLHRVHHSDTEVDTTTGLRFHPVEIVISMAWKIGVVVALGAPAGAVVLFEAVLNATSLFNHGNVAMPKRLDDLLRLVLVTPHMHRVHHSAVPAETDSNYGFNLPWWDRLFGTYRQRPAAGESGMTVGLEYLREPANRRLDVLLYQPLVDERRTG
jgi:sterol desaturase/sphingolipid hydroxylase (fatty acid hydroxylase superfamily)